MVKPHRYYEDLVIGETHTSKPRSVTAKEIIAFASQYDPQYFHADVDAAQGHPQFGELVASGIHILAIWRQLDHLITGDVRWICGIEWKRLRWNKPLRAGDEVRARAQLVGKRASSKAHRGIVEYRYSMLNQDDDDVFYCLSTNLVERHQEAAGTNGQ